MPSLGTRPARVQAPGQGRFARARTQPGGAAAPGRVDERRIHPGQVHLADVGRHGLRAAAHAAGHGVEHGHPQVQRIPVDGPDLVLPGQGDQITADAAAQVGQRAGLC